MATTWARDAVLEPALPHYGLVVRTDQVSL
jgi:hypothetical protein